MQKNAFRAYQKRALYFAALVLAVVLTLFAIGREILLLSRVEQSLLRQQLDLQMQKELLEESINDNLVIMWGVAAFLAADEDYDLNDPEFTGEIVRISKSLKKISEKVLGMVVVTGLPSKPWTSAYAVNFSENTFNSSNLPDLSDLATQSLREQSIATRAIGFAGKSLLVVATDVKRDEKPWGFVFCFIDLSQIVTEFTQFMKLSKREKTSLYLPGLGVTDWSKAPQKNDTSVVIGFISNSITLFQNPPTFDQSAVFPLWIAIPLILFIGLGSSFFTYALSFERAKSNWFSLFDPLLGIPNRRFLEQQFRKTNQGNLLLFNIDNFRSVNEKYGFAVGDQVLTEVTSRIRQVLSPKDFIARLGSDELVVLPNDTNTNYANQVSQQIQQAMTEPMLVNRQMINITTIISISSYPKNGTDLSTLIEYADHQQVRDDIIDQDTEILLWD